MNDGEINKSVTDFFWTHFKPESKPMKKYRCKIDYPGANKGEVRTEEELNKHIFRFFYGEKKPKDFPDMWEELPDRWVPKEGEEYFPIVSDDWEFSITEAIWRGDTADQRLLKQNRVFRTKEKAEEVLKKLLQVLEENKEV